MEGYSEYTQSALEILRNPQMTMHWYVVPLLLIMIGYNIEISFMFLIIDCSLVAVAFRDFLKK